MQKMYHHGPFHYDNLMQAVFWAFIPNTCVFLGQNPIDYTELNENQAFPLNLLGLK